jgi:hypothetical protein
VRARAKGGVTGKGERDWGHTRGQPQVIQTPRDCSSPPGTSLPQYGHGEGGAMVHQWYWRCENPNAPELFVGRPNSRDVRTVDCSPGGPASECSQWPTLPHQGSARGFLRQEAFCSSLTRPQIIYMFIQTRMLWSKASCNAWGQEPGSGGGTSAMERIPIAMGGGVAVKHAFKLVTRLFKHEYGGARQVAMHGFKGSSMEEVPRPWRGSQLPWVVA